MAKLSLREAVKVFDVSRPTLTKSLNSGKLSGVRNGKGQWEIDPAELSRVYQTRQPEMANGGKNESGKLTAVNTPYPTELDRLKSALTLAEARADAAEKLAQERAERIEDLRRLLPPPPEDATPRRPRWRWPWGRE